MLTAETDTQTHSLSLFLCVSLPPPLSIHPSLSVFLSLSLSVCRSDMIILLQCIFIFAKETMTPFPD